MKLQHFDKFIIAAFIATLLCIAFKADAQRGMRVAGRTTIVNTSVTNNIDSSEVNTITYGLLDNDTLPQFVIGYLDYVYPGYTYNQKKTIRQANWEAFQAASQWAVDNKARVSLPPTVVEMHLANGESIVLGQYETLTIKGAGKNSSLLYFYPHARLWNTVAIDADAKGCNVVLEDFAIYSEKEKIETYNVTLRPGGNTNQIQITDSNVLAATAASFIGKTVYASTDNITLATGYTVTNYNSGTKTLTLNTTVTATGSDDAGILGLFFAEDTPRDSILAYGDNWRTDNVESYFIYGVEASQPDVTAQTFTYLNMDIQGFDGQLFLSGDNITINMTNTYISAHIIGIAMYSNFTTESYIYLTNCIFEENSHSIIGYINGSYTAGNLLGSAIYSHPNVQWRFLNCTFKGNNGGVTRQYSSGGGKPTPSTAISFITNCQWYSNQEYDVLTSETQSSVYTNCSFGGAVYAHNTTQFVNCEFKGYLSSYDDGGDLKFKGCVFKSGTQISINQRDNFLEFEGCTFTPNSSTYTIAASVDALILRNCKFLNNGVASGTNPIFQYAYPPKFIIENCNFQDVDAYLFWRFSPDVDNYSSLASFDKVLIKGCKFAYTPFNNNQVSISNVNLIIEDCIFANGTIASYYGNYNVSPRKNLSKNILTGSTISVGPNSNHYFTDGTINKIAVTTGVDGYFYFTSADTTIFTGYANPGNTGSNLNFSTTVYPNQTIQLYFDATQTKAGTTNTVTNDVIGTGNGSSKCFTRWSELFSTESTPVKRGTLVVTAGAVVLTDNGSGILTGSGGSGWVDYFRNTVVLCYDSAVGNGTNITATYDYYTSVHQNGMWSKVE